MIKNITIKRKTNFLPIMFVVLASNFILVCNASETKDSKLNVDLCSVEDIFAVPADVCVAEPMQSDNVCLNDVYESTLKVLREPTLKDISKAKSIFDLRLMEQMAFRSGLGNDYFYKQEELIEEAKKEIFGVGTIYALKGLKKLAGNNEIIDAYEKRFKQLQDIARDRLIKAETVLEIRDLIDIANVHELRDFYEKRIEELQAPIRERIAAAKKYDDLKQMEELAADFDLVDLLAARDEEIKRLKREEEKMAEQIFSSGMENAGMASWVMKNTKKNVSPEGDPHILEGSTELLVSEALINKIGINRNVPAIGKITVENRSDKSSRKFGIKVHNSSIYVSPDSSCFKPIAPGASCEFDISYVGKTGRLLRNSVSLEVLGEKGKSDAAVIDIVDLPANAFFNNMCFDDGELTRSIGARSIYSISATSKYGDDFLYVGTNNGVFKTDVHKEYWISVGLQDYQVLDLEMVFGNGSSILYAATHKHGVFKTGDGGVSWEQLNKGLGNLDVRALQSVFSEEGVVLFAGTKKGVFKFVDDIGVWKEVSRSLKNLSIRTLYLAEVDNKPILYVGTDDGVYKTLNGGMVWEPANFETNDKSSVHARQLFEKILLKELSHTANAENQTASYNHKAVILGEAWASMVLAKEPVCPVHLREMWKPTNFDTYQTCSLDSQKLWRNETLASSFMAASAVPSAEDLLKDFGVDRNYLSELPDISERISWGESDLENIPICSLHYVDDVLYAGTMGTGVLRNIYDGTGWKKAGLENKFVCSLISAEGILYAGVYGGGISKSADFGETWIKVSDEVENRRMLTLESVRSKSGLSIYAGTDKGVIFKAHIADYKGSDT